MNRAIKALPLFFILAMLILATAFYSLSQADNKTYQNKTDLIRNINEQSALLSLAIILATRKENIDYDLVTLAQQNLIKLAQQLPIDKPESITLNQSVLKRSNQVEQIKSLHAIYRNSLLFYPKASRQLKKLLKKTSQTNELIEMLSSLEHNLLSFHINPYQLELIQNTQAIINASVIASLNPETELHLDLLLKHVQIIIDYRLKLKKLFTNILNSPVTEQSHVILKRYHADYQSSLDKAETMRKGFYISTFFFIICVILMPCRLKTSSKLS